MITPMPPTGAQFEIRSGDARATVTEVGGGLRAFTVGGRAFVETYEVGSRPPRGAGAVLVPWPNRTAGGPGLPTGPVTALADAVFPLRGAELDHAFGGCLPVDGLVRHRLAGPDDEVELWADPDFGWVQVFTPDDHPARGRVVAVEPMTCPPDALNSGVGLLTVQPGETWTGRWGVAPR